MTLLKKPSHAKAQRRKEKNVGQTSRDHQAGQARRVGDVALMQVESATLLVREKGLDTISFAVPVTGFLDQFHIGDELGRD